MNIVIGPKKFAPLDPAIVTRLMDYGVADLHESLSPARRNGSLMSHNMRPITAGIQVVGQAVTAATVPGDNLILYAGLDVVEAGQILLMSNGGVSHGALFGDVSASFAMKQGVAGIIVDGPVRDVATLREMRCPVWSTIISPSHPEKRGPGSINLPILCGGCIVNPGDIIVADDDAVMVIRPDEVHAVLDAAEMRQNREIVYRQRISSGEHISDILGMRELVASMTTFDNAL